MLSVGDASTWGLTAEPVTEQGGSIGGGGEDQGHAGERHCLLCSPWHASTRGDPSAPSDGGATRRA